jgi:hypothetical protein
MDARDLLLKVKEVVAPALLAIDGVSGAGVGADALNVYLAEDNPAVRERVRNIVSAASPETRINFIVSGSFRAL